MTNEEAIKEFEYCIEENQGFMECRHASKEAYQTAIKALEKQIPQKPYKVGVRDYECPKCHKFLHVVGYPCRCGQMIDWRGEE